MINNIALEIIKRFNINTLVETGIWRQNTLLLLQDWNSFELNCPVKYIGVDTDEKAVKDVEELHGKDNSLIRVVWGDSRDFLKALIESGELEKSNVLFYLDAHWNYDWPLLGELEILMGFPKSIIAIDDFYTPAHPKYGFDSYHGNDCGADYIKPIIIQRTNIIYYAALCNKDQRGMCIIFIGFSEKMVDDTLFNLKPLNIDDIYFTSVLEIIKDKL